VKTHTPHENPSDRETELAELRAEVARALSTDTPDVAVLTAALERVDAMLDAAHEELASALHEIVEQLGIGRPELPVA